VTDFKLKISVLILLLVTGVSFAHKNVEPFHVENWRIDPDFQIDKKEYYGGPLRAPLQPEFHKVLDRINLTLLQNVITDVNGIETYDHSLRDLSPPSTWVPFEEVYASAIKTVVVKVRYGGENPIDLFFIVRLEQAELVDYFYQNVKSQ